MISMIHDELKTIYDKNNTKEKERNYPKYPTYWQVLLYYFMYVNNLPKTTVSLLATMPNYMLLPNTIERN